MRIAILGWGSLIWDKRPEFDEWQYFAHARLVATFEHNMPSPLSSTDVLIHSLDADELLLGHFTPRIIDPCLDTKETRLNKRDQIEIIIQ